MKPRLVGVYKIERVDGKVYVGSSVNVWARKANHFSALRSGRHVNTYLQHAWDETRGEGFTFAVIESGLDAERLAEREQFWMDALNAVTPHGFNLVAEAGRPPTLSPEHYVRLGAMKRGVKRPQHVVEKIAAALRGRKHSLEEIAKRAAANRGKKRTPEQIERSASKKRGRPMSDEQRAKLSASLKGRPRDPELVARTAAANTGKKRPQYVLDAMQAGRQRVGITAEHRARMSAAQQARHERGDGPMRVNGRFI
jgi:group I intron endonuclease